MPSKRGKQANVNLKGELKRSFERERNGGKRT
jgi:hypothetical protein